MLYGLLSTSYQNGISGCFAALQCRSSGFWRAAFKLQAIMVGFLGAFLAMVNRCFFLMKNAAGGQLELLQASSRASS